MKELKDELMNYLPKLINGINTIAIYFHANKLDEGFKLLGEAVEGIDWASKAYSSLTSNSANDLNSLNLALDQFNSSMENKDFVSSGDILEYEISPVLTDMYQNLSGQNLNH